MPSRLSSRRGLLLAGVSLASLCLAGAAYGLERITLRNGFAYDCAREQAIDPAHTRLFLSAGSEASYVDIPTAEIAAIDKLAPLTEFAPPDKLAPPVAAVASSARKPPPHPLPHTAPLDTRTLLANAGSAHNIDVELLASLAQTESSGHPHAVSHAGAQGLMQLMPSTARSVGVNDSFAPDQNVNGGTTYLDWLLTRYRNDLALALAAYNAGPGAVDRFHGIPPYRETRLYVIRVMTEFKRRKEALRHPSTPNPLEATR